MASSLGRLLHSYLYACALKDHLAMKQNFFLKIAELDEIQSLRVHVPAPGHGIEEPVCVVLSIEQGT